MITYHSKMKDKDWEVQCDECEIKNNYMILKWSGTPGWGEITIVHNPDDSFYIDDECMGADFCAAIMQDWLHQQMSS